MGPAWLPHILGVFLRTEEKRLPSLSPQSKQLIENFKSLLQKIMMSLYNKTLIKLECSRNEVIWFIFSIKLEFLLLKLKCTGIFFYFIKYG